MADREKVIKGLEICTSIEDGDSCPNECPYYQDVCCGYDQLMRDAIDLLKEQNDAIEKADSMLKIAEDKIKELLKEQEAVVNQWKKEIADNQLAHAPNDSHEFMSLDEHLENEYKMGIWDGLQIAWNIISEGR